MKLPQWHQQVSMIHLPPAHNRYASPSPGPFAPPLPVSYKYTYITRRHAHARAHARAYTHARTQYARTCTYTYTHTRTWHMRTYTHTNNDTHLALKHAYTTFGHVYTKNCLVEPGSGKTDLCMTYIPPPYTRMYSRGDCDEGWQG